MKACTLANIASIAALALLGSAPTTMAVDIASTAKADYTLLLISSSGCTVRFNDQSDALRTDSIADTLLFTDTNEDGFLTAEGDDIAQALTEGVGNGTGPRFQCTGPGGAQMTITSERGGLRHNTYEAAVPGFTTLVPYTFAWTFAHVGTLPQDSGSFDSDTQGAGVEVVQLTRSGGGLVGSLSGTVTLDSVTEEPLIAGTYRDTMTITVDAL